MRRAHVVAAVTGLIAVTTGIVAAPAAIGAGSTVISGTIPAGNRYEPRVADLLGANAAGFVYRQETDQGYASPGGGFLTRWHSFSGDDDHSLGNVTGTVVGNHLVRLNTSVSPNTVTDTALPGGTSTEVAVPAGDFVLSATSDGILVASASMALGLQAWGSTTVTPVTGLPANAVQINHVSGPTTMSAHGALIQVAPDGGGLALYYVDSSVPHAWQLTTQTAYGAAISPDGITWEQPVMVQNPNNSSINVVIARVPVPQPGDVSAAAPSTRPDVAVDGRGPQGWTTLALGDNVLVWPVYDPQQYARDGAFGLFTIYPGGGHPQLAGWAHSVVPMTDGQHVLVITGNTPTTEQISQLAADATTFSTVQAIAPIASRTGQLAVDGSTVARVTDGWWNGSTVSNSVTAGDGGVSVGADQSISVGAQQVPPSTCTSGMCSSIVTAGGVTSFINPDNFHLQTFTGGDFTQGTALTGQDNGLRGSDGRHVLIDSRNASYDSLYDIASGIELPTTLMKPALADGVLYGFAPNTQQTEITALTLGTGTRTTYPLPSGCAFADLTPQVAGTNLLLRCGSTMSSPFDTWAVVNMSDSSKTWVEKVSGSLGTRWLGNGFVVSSDTAGNLQWTDLGDPAHSWQTLGSWAGVPGTIAVDRSGRQATVAWTDSDALTHVAILPIATPTKHTTTLATSASATVLAGATAVLTTTLTDTTKSVGLGGMALNLLQRTSPTAKFTLAASLGTGAAGQASVHVKPSRTTQYAWAFAGTGTANAAYSGITAMTVTQHLTAAAQHSTVKRHKRITIYGTAAPASTGQHVTLQQKLHGSWKSLSGPQPARTQKLPNGKRSFGYVIVKTESKAGTYVFRAVISKSPAYGATASPSVTVIVKK